MLRPKNCKKCGGKKMQIGGKKDCPEGLVFNPQTEECEIPNITGETQFIQDGYPFLTPRIPMFNGEDEVGLHLPPVLATDEEDMAHDRPQMKNNRVPQNTLQRLGIGMQGLRTGLGYLAGAVERGRQNKYDYFQQTALGMMNPMPATDFQPNPYSLYAKYGGSLKQYMHGGNKEMAPFHNLPPEQYDMILQQLFGQQTVPPGFHMMPDGTMMPDEQMKYGGLQHVKYFGPPFSNGAKMDMTNGEKFDKVFMRRFVVPKLFKRTKRDGGIHIKPENKGKFTDYCGGKVTSECIRKGLNSPSATIRKRANFARNARKWN